MRFFFLVFADSLVILFRRFTARLFIIRRDIVSRSSCRLTGYSTTAFLLFATIDQNITAVRKNRYVILPIDFEEAWKVGNFFPAYMNAISNTSFSLPLANSQEKRRDTRVLYARKSTVCIICIDTDTTFVSPQIDSICKLAVRCLHRLVVVILTSCSFPCTLDLITIYALFSSPLRWLSSDCTLLSLWHLSCFPHRGAHSCEQYYMC
jgi:hypothetical protein